MNAETVKSALLYLILAALLMIGWSNVLAAPESAYRDKWCAARNGQTEVRLPDGTRVDCVTKFYAVEVDFSKKWAEAVGQALWYAANTGRVAKIVLIVDFASNASVSQYERVRKLIWHYELPIDLEAVDITFINE